MVYGKVVFDAEPLLTAVEGTPGQERVAKYFIEIQSGAVDAYISPIQLTEIRYIGRNMPKGHRIDEYLQQIQVFMTTAPVDEATWKRAAEFKANEGHSLGDSYALATADVLDAVLIVGADDDFDDVPVEIERIRDEPS